MKKLLGKAVMFMVNHFWDFNLVGGGFLRLSDATKKHEAGMVIFSGTHPAVTDARCELFIGGVLNNRLVVPNNSAMNIWVDLVGMNSAGTAGAGGNWGFVVQNSNGVLEIVAQGVSSVMNKSTPPGFNTTFNMEINQTLKTIEFVSYVTPDNFGAKWTAFVRYTLMKF